MGQVIKLGAQGKKELAIAFKVTMAYVGQVLSGQKRVVKPLRFGKPPRNGTTASCTMLTKSPSMKQSKSSTTRVM